jgi:putative inorganic carbon (hco3(-)) transporter
VPAPLLIAAALAAGGAAGLAFAVDVPLGVAFVSALCFGPVALLNLPAGIATLSGLSYVDALPVLGVAPLATFLIVLMAWVGVATTRGSEILVRLREERVRLALVGGLLLWIVLSHAWAAQPELGTEVLLEWLTAGGLFAIVATALGDDRSVRLVLAALVIGAVVSVLVGLTNDELTQPASALETSEDERRLRGGSGDPNFLAAGLVPAAVIAGGMLASTRRPLTRVLLVAAIGVMAVGFAAAESRGGLVALAVAVVAAFVVFRGARAYVVTFVTFLVGVAALWFVLNPAAWERVTTFDRQGNGRSDLWSVAWQIGVDHPVEGVGINNFRAESPSYVRRPGSLEFVDLIAEKPKVAHNVFLQLFAEVGLIGLGLFAAVLVACFAATARAARRLAASGRRELATLSRTVLVAGIAGWSSAVFLSNGTDRRLWILLAVGVACHGLALRASSRSMPTP